MLFSAIALQDHFTKHKYKQTGTKLISRLGLPRGVRAPIGRGVSLNPPSHLGSCSPRGPGGGANEACRGYRRAGSFAQPALRSGSCSRDAGGGRVLNSKIEEMSQLPDSGVSAWCFVPKKMFLFSVIGCLPVKGLEKLSKRYQLIIKDLTSTRLKMKYNRIRL